MLEIGTVRMKNVSDDFKGLEGMKLLLMHSCEGCERIVVNPIRQEDFEKYYKNSFETMGKEWVNDDYKSFLKYMLSENCEFISYIQVNDLENIRPATKDDWIEYLKVRKMFIEKHNLKLENN